MAKKKATHTPQSSFRLPAETKRQLKELSDRHMGANGTQIVIRAVAELHAREFGPPKTPRKKSGEVA